MMSPPPQPPAPQMWGQSGELGRPVVTDVAWPSPPPPPPPSGAVMEPLKEDELVAVSQLLSIRFHVSKVGHTHTSP